MEKNELQQNDQEIADELNIFFWKDTVSNLKINENPFIIKQVSGDILDPAENVSISVRFIQAYYLSKIGLNQNLLSFHAI